MRAIRVASAALLAAAALSLAAPTAALADEGTGSDTTPKAGARAGGLSSAPTDAAATQVDPGDVAEEAGGEGTPGVGVGAPGTSTDGAGTDAAGAANVGAAGDAAPSAVVAPSAEAAPSTDGTASDVTPFGFSVTPATVAPGDTVTLTSDGCEASSVTVTSGVFDTVTLTEGRAGTATIDVEAKIAAEYEVTFDCKGEKGTAPLTIAAGSTGHSAGGHVTGADKGVKAGFGGGAGELGTTEVVMGSALIAGALGGGGMLLMRRRGSGDSA
ncbi:hypothetical protein ABZ946_03025 [Streptomyces sp. NPDC046324]|uniref:hypothetical protein n=1 Tax=Streptomyces sp. NPDC046324 TaxID=3154915 RepID=UPI0033E4842E